MPASRRDIFEPRRCLPASSLEKYGWNEDAAVEDYELYLNLCTEGEFARNKELLCAWRLHGRNTSDDFPLMLSEHIAAQDRLAVKLGINDVELADIQRRLKFRAVSDHVRHGKRREAFRLFQENLSGRESVYHAARVFTQMAVPVPLFQWNRERKRRKAIARYGRLRPGIEG